jgi:hypothetical protein
MPGKGSPIQRIADAFRDWRDGDRDVDVLAEAFVQWRAGNGDVDSFAPTLSRPDIARLSVRALAGLSWREFGVLALLAGSWGAGFILSEGEAKKEFYTAAASVIPTLLLALAVTAAWLRLGPRPRSSVVADEAIAQLSDDERKLIADRVLGHDPGLPPTKRDVLPAVHAALAGVAAYLHALTSWLFRVVYATALLAALIVGEVVALHALMTGNPEGSNPRWVLAAIAAGFIGVAIVGLGGTSGHASADAVEAAMDAEAADQDQRRGEEALDDRAHAEPDAHGEPQAGASGREPSDQ